MKYFSHLNTATAILEEYDGTVPFHNYIKDYFKQYRKFGSRDRRSISHLCYCCFRTGHSLSSLPFEDRIVAGLFLCSSHSNEVLQQLAPELDAVVSEPFPEKWKEIRKEFPALAEDGYLKIFPVRATEFSEQVDAHEFVLSHLSQPDFFIRIRPGHEVEVLNRLRAVELPFRTEHSAHTIRLASGSKIEDLFEPDVQIVVQDYSSQRTQELMRLVDIKEEIRIWDCCTGSGGKALLAHDLFPHAKLTVSDIRESILYNLSHRFEKAGIKNYESFVWDMQQRAGKTNAANFVIADVPCTGSGTWGRNPENLVYFEPSLVPRYSELQKKIVSNATPLVELGGYFLYITCSVLHAENEDVIKHLSDAGGWKLIRKELLKGYDMKADSMFAALFQRTN